MTNKQTWMRLVFPIVGLLFLAAGMVWTNTPAVTAQEPELTPWAYLPLVMNLRPPTLDDCEPNGTPALACPIEPGVHQAHISSLYDQDWYVFTLDDESQVAIRLHMPEDDNYDLYLYGDPPSWPIAYSVTLGNAEETITIALSAGSYYILIFPAVQALESPYELTLEVGE
jgi:hypothetical protein